MVRVAASIEAVIDFTMADWVVAKVAISVDIRLDRSLLIRMAEATDWIS